MAIDFARLVGQGRAYSAARAWEPEELEALLTLESERGIGRLVAADFVRNGVLTLEAYDKAVAAEFKPRTLDEAAAEAEESLKDNDFAVDPKAEVAVEAVDPKAEVAVEAVDPKAEVAVEAVESPKKGRK